MNTETPASTPKPDSITKKEPSPAYLFGIPVVATLALLMWQTKTYVNNHSSNETIPPDAVRVSSESSLVTIDVVNGNQLLIETPANTHLVETSVASMCEGLSPSDPVVEKDCIQKFDDLTRLNPLFDDRDQKDQIKLEIVVGVDGKPMIHLEGNSTIPLDETNKALEKVLTYQTRSKQDIQNLFIKTAILTGSSVGTILTLAYLNRKLRTKKEIRDKTTPKSKKSRRRDIVLNPFKDNTLISNVEEPTKDVVQTNNTLITTLRKNTTQKEAEKKSTREYYMERKYSPAEVIEHILQSPDFQKSVDQARKNSFDKLAHAYDAIDGIGRENNESPYLYTYKPENILKYATELITTAIHTNPELSINDLADARDGLLADAYRAILTAAVIGGKRKTLTDHLYYTFFQKRQTGRFGKK